MRLLLPLLAAFFLTGGAAPGQTPEVRYVDNEFAALAFAGSSPPVVTTLERVSPDPAVIAIRTVAGDFVVRDVGLTPGQTYRYQTRRVNPVTGQSAVSPAVALVAGQVKGTLDQSMTWEGVRRLTGQVTVPEGTTLTVVSNAVVEQAEGFAGAGQLEVLGRLEARGARFHESQDNPDSFGFRIRSGANAQAPFGSMLLHQCVFRQVFLTAAHGLEFAGNRTDLEGDASELEWQEVPGGTVMAQENWPSLSLRLGTLGGFTFSNSVVHRLILSPRAPGPSSILLKEVTFRERRGDPGSLDVDSLGAGTLRGERLGAATNEFLVVRASDGSGAVPNHGSLQFVDCSRIARMELRAITNGLVAGCRFVPRAGSGGNGILLDSCQAVLVRDNVLRGTNIGQFSRGVDLVATRDCVVFGNEIRGFGRGISLGDGSTGNLVTSNRCVRNGGAVVFNRNAGGPPSGNLLANNVFASRNPLAVTFDDPEPFTNFWSFPDSTGPNIKGGPRLGGNFWGVGFFGSDTNLDGISETVFVLRTNHVDLRPLMPATNLVVNLRGDESDADEEDNEPDIDPDEPGLQTTLRSALSTALLRPGDKRVVFDLGSATPQMPPFVITVTNGPLPEVRSNTVVDARSQPNRVLLDGADRPNTSGLTLGAGFNQLLGLWFRRWGAAGVTLGPLSFSNLVQDCRFGIDPAEPPATNVTLGTHGLVVQGIGHRIGGGNLDEGNEFGNARQFGLQLFGSLSVSNQGHLLVNNLVGFTLRNGRALPQPNRGGGIELRSGQAIRIGDSFDGNFITGNRGSGIFIHNGFGGFARDIRVQNNDIGFVDAGLAEDPFRLTNSLHGVEIDARVTNVVIGATLAEALEAGSNLADVANRIAFNGGSGVRMAAVTSRQISWRHNLVHDNRLLGVDVGSSGVTTNQNADGFQNFPVFDSEQASPGTELSGFLVSDPGDYRLEFYASAAPDPTLHGEGEAFLGSLPLTIPPGVNSNRFVFPLPAAPGGFVSAVATDALGHSSEFARALGGLVVNLESDEPDPNLGDGLADVNLAEPGLQTTLRCALENADLTPGPDTIRFVVPKVNVAADLAPVRHPVVIDGTVGGNPVVATFDVGSPVTFSGAGTVISGVSFFVRSEPRKSADVLRFLDAHGARIRGCTFFECGVRVTGSTGVEIGGTGAGQGNTFTFRALGGTVRLEGALTTGARIQGNRFDVLFPNTPLLELVDAPGNFIGGATDVPGAGAGNGFGTSGAICVLLRGEGCRNNRVQGNRFGLAEGGDRAGVAVSLREGAHDNLVGGTASDERNVCEFLNLGVRVAEDAGPRNSILGNQFEICDAAIDLGSSGFTSNSVPASTTGPNLLQNFPEFSRKTFLDRPMLRGTLRGRPGIAHRIEVYVGGNPFRPSADGRRTLGSPNRLLAVVTGVVTDASGLAAWEVENLGESPVLPVTATATDADGNTSEFSPLFQEYVVTSDGNEGAAGGGDGDPRAIVTLTDPPVITLRSVLEASRLVRIPARVGFSFAGATRIPVPKALPEVNIPLQFDNTPNDLVPVPREVVLDGTAAPELPGFDGLVFGPGSDGSSARGMALGGFPRNGLVLRSRGNVVDGCRIGSVALVTGPNRGHGIEVRSDANRVGGELGNFIGGNGAAGIALIGPPPDLGFDLVTGNQVVHCFIGPGGGVEAFPNAIGVHVDHAPGNLLGRRPGQPASFGRNLFCANPTGVLISGPGASNNVVAGALFGENLDGGELGRSERGIHLVDAPRNRVGGASVDENFLVGHDDAAIVVEGEAAVANEIFGNEIGRTRLTFPTQPRNARGIVVKDAVDTRIGHADAERGNFLGNCSGPALELGGRTRGTVVAGNLFGMYPNGSVASNHSAAVLIDVASTGPASHPNTIGFLGAGTLAANRIVHSAAGIVVRRGLGQRVTGNLVHHTGGPGIDLGGDGPTPNGPDPAEVTAPNHFQDFPEITNLVASAASLAVSGRVRSPGGALRLEFFGNDACAGAGFGEGRTFLGEATIASVPGVNEFAVELPVTAVPPAFLSATATDNFGNTSEFGPCLPVPTAAGEDGDGDGVPDQVEESGLGTTDINGDGISDALQANVLLASAGAGGGEVTAVAGAGQAFSGFSAAPDFTQAPGEPSVNPFDLPLPPLPVSFPLGIASFKLQVSAPGASRALAQAGTPSGALAEVRLTFPTNAAPNSYWTFGPEAPGAPSGWRRFQGDGSVPGASAVLGNPLVHLGRTNGLYVVTLKLEDGGRGDADGVANGSIRHLGGPGREPFALRNVRFRDGGVPGVLDFELPAVPGRRYVLERSPNLVDWTPAIPGDDSPDWTVRFAEPTAAPPARFLRGREE